MESILSLWHLLTKDLKEVRALPSIIKDIQKMKEAAAKAAAEAEDD